MAVLTPHKYVCNHTLVLTHMIVPLLVPGGKICASAALVFERQVLNYGSEDVNAVAGNAEIRLRHCLDPRVRRWCSCEFFCSAIDRPWLMRNELTGYLTHVGIAKGTKLARPELAIIRASLGRPRRLSLGYLRQVSLSCGAITIF